VLVLVRLGGSCSSSTAREAERVIRDRVEGAGPSFWAAGTFRLLDEGGGGGGEVATSKAPGMGSVDFLDALVGLLGVCSGSGSGSGGGVGFLAALGIVFREGRRVDCDFEGGAKGSS